VDQASARVHPSPERADTPGLKGRLARDLLVRSLQGLAGGRLELETPEGMLLLGDPAAELKARVVIHDPRAYELGAFRGEIGLGEAYALGYWSSPDPVAVVRLAVRNLAALERSQGWLARGAMALARLRHRRRANDVAGSRANIQAHYDLGNAFYRLFLDETMAYSCACFESARDSLEDAQRRKYDVICRKLELSPADHLLEIGTGWGGFAAHAASRYGCRVTTTTLSAEQHAQAGELFRESRLEGRITLLLEDYRQLRGSFDKVVSIEMFEAVGLRYYDRYFRAVQDLLKPGGAFLMQTITMNEQHFPDYIRGTDWIQQYIFPGAELASVAEILRSTARVTGLALEHFEEIGPHYARTLHHWRDRFLARRSEARRQGFDERFLRTWDYYLAYCEGAFAERHIGDAQLLFRQAADPARRS
jgi:cyclopropane-fatty-acyl-phospholipid synthase